MDLSFAIPTQALLARRAAATPSPTPTPTPASAPGYLAGIAAAPYAAYGAQRVVSGYAGPLMRLRRASDSVEADYSAQSGGDYPDYAAIDTWAGGSAVTVVTLYDQSGNARHMTQATAANQPSFDTSQTFGNVVPVLFDGYGRTATATNPHVDKHLSVSGLTGLNAVQMAAFFAMQPQTSSNRIGHWAGSNAALTTHHHEQLHGLTINVITNRIAGTNKNASTSGPKMHFTPNAFGASSDGAGVLRQWSNGATGTTGAVSTTPQAVEVLTLGKAFVSAPQFNGAYRLFGAVFYAANVSEADGNSLIASINTAFGHGNGFGTAPEYNVLLIGDSIIEGTGSRLLENMPRLLDAGLTKPRRLFSYGVHGERLSTADAGRTGRYGGTAVAGVPNVAFIQGGINDIGAGTTGANLYANTTTPLVAYLQGLGYKVVVCTLLPRADGPWTGAMEAERDAYNAAVAGNAAAADAVLDLTANPTMGPDAAASDTTLYGDNLHPTSLGYAWLAGAPSGTYANAATYYDKLRDVLRTTALGGSYVP